MWQITHGNPCHSDGRNARVQIQSHKYFLAFGQGKKNTKVPWAKASSHRWTQSRDGDMGRELGQLHNLAH